MDNIPTYINRKHGEEPVDCLHKMLEPILKETYGVIIYQEQVMQIAQVMAGYSLGEADLLRRAMGKKDKNEMAKQQARFVEGALKNGVKKDDAVFIFELVDKFAGYGFNKSHAAAYALVSYHTAYLKANYREEFLAASMTLDMGNTDKLAMFTSEARKFDIKVELPCVNESEVDFLPGPKRIRYSLAALKNIGASAVEALVAERQANGPFKSLADFASRSNPKTLNKRALETLAAAGAFDALEPNRALVAGNVEQILALGNRLASDAAQGITDLFGGGSGSKSGGLDLRPQKNWTPMEKLQHEFDAVGFFLSGHPLDSYAGIMNKLGVVTYAHMEAKAERGNVAARVAGIVVSVRERRSQKGNKFAFAMFSDSTGQFESVIFSDVLNAARDLLTPGTPVVVSVEGERDGDTLKLRTQGIQSLDDAAASVQRGLKVRLDKRVVQSKNTIGELKAMLKPGGKGSIVLSLDIDEKGREVEFAIPGKFDISPAQQGALWTVPGVVEVVEV
jgi:DNA polymerase-3 subunit alpha